MGPREEVTTEQVGRSLKSAYTEGTAVVSADYLAQYSLCVHLSFGRQKKSSGYPPTLSMVLVMPSQERQKQATKLSNNQ